MSTPALILTIALDRDSKITLWVSARNADGTQTPPQKVAVDQDRRLADFVDTVQAIRRELAPIESAPQGRTPDGDPVIAVDAARGEQVRQRCHAAASNATRLQCSTGRGTPAVLATMVSTSAMVKISSGIFARADLDYIIQMRGATIQTDRATAIHPLQ